jgi:hypothetical protein
MTTIARAYVALVFTPLLTSACAPTPPAAPNDSSETVMNQDIAARFPGAVILGEEEFASAVVGRQFRYRALGSELVIELPGEVFQANGSYRLHRTRSIQYGTYSFDRGVVAINCVDCSQPFLGFGKERVFFRHKTRLFMTSANPQGNFVELIPEPLKGDALRVLLSDVYVEPVRPAGGVIVSEWPGEIFRSDGSYIRISNRSRRYGTFEIKGDLVCVRGDGIKYQCRRVVPVESGTYTLTDISDGSSMRVTIAPHK